MEWPGAKASGHSVVSTRSSRKGSDLGVAEATSASVDDAGTKHQHRNR